MLNGFTRNIARDVLKEIALADFHESGGRLKEAFQHLENGHVLGQSSTWWHVRVHWLMLLWAFRHKDWREFFGQLIRILGAASKTAIGLVPVGNTGGANISPFKTFPLKAEHQIAIEKAICGQ